MNILQQPESHTRRESYILTVEWNLRIHFVFLMFFWFHKKNFIMFRIGFEKKKISKNTQLLWNLRLKIFFFSFRSIFFNFLNTLNST